MEIKHIDYPARVLSGNINATAATRAIEAAGHRLVKKLADLLTISDFVLSDTGDNTDNDALGQEWYVQEDGKLHQLISWENRKKAEGWIIKPDTTELKGALDKETADRKAADTQLQLNIDTEKTRAEAAEKTLTDNLAKEVIDREAADTTLDNKIDTTKQTIDNYTVNGHKISTSPVLNGGDVKLDNYTISTATGADLDVKPTDTTNQAFGKLAKEIDDTKAEVEKNKIVDTDDIRVDASGTNTKLYEADRPVNADKFISRGYKILRPNIVDGKNILTLDMINAPNTTYVIRLDFDMNGALITFPDGTKLIFDGGILDNGNVAGNIINEYLLPEYFGAKGDGKSDDSLAFRKCYLICDKIVLTKGKNYACYLSITRENDNTYGFYDKNFEIVGNNSTITLIETDTLNPSSFITIGNGSINLIKTKQCHGTLNIHDISIIANFKSQTARNRDAYIIDSSIDNIILTNVSIKNVNPDDGCTAINTFSANVYLNTCDIRITPNKYIGGLCWCQWATNGNKVFSCRDSYLEYDGLDEMIGLLTSYITEGSATVTATIQNTTLYTSNTVNGHTLIKCLSDKNNSSKITFNVSIDNSKINSNEGNYYHGFILATIYSSKTNINVTNCNIVLYTNVYKGVLDFRNDNATNYYGLVHIDGNVNKGNIKSEGIIKLSDCNITSNYPNFVGDYYGIFGLINIYSCNINMSYDFLYNSIVDYNIYRIKNSFISYNASTMLGATNIEATNSTFINSSNSVGAEEFNYSDNNNLSCSMIFSNCKYINSNGKSINLNNYTKTGYLITMTRRNASLLVPNSVFNNCIYVAGDDLEVRYRDGVEHKALYLYNMIDNTKIPVDTDSSITNGYYSPFIGNIYEGFNLFVITDESNIILDHIIIYKNFKDIKKMDVINGEVINLRDGTLASKVSIIQ